jgi:hypothetical protein
LYPIEIYLEVSNEKDGRNHDESVMSEIQDVAGTDEMLIPILIKLLIHSDASDEQRNIDPNPRPEAIENLFCGCVVKWVSENVSSSCRWSGA